VSAIFGIIDRFGHAIDPVCTGRMIAALAHRGPDGQSGEHGPGFTLGHCLLDTAGTGPAMGCLAVEGNIVVIADCRIDNRDELAESIDIPVAASDALMLLRAYLRWGEDFPNHILGDFSVAIWNALEKTLFCARDHFGVKPFYYYSNSRYFVFASELGAVLASGLAETTLSGDRIADFLSGLAPPVDQTSYQDLLRLPPASYCTLAESGLHVAAYWTLPKPATRTWADAPGEFRRLLTQAVAARLRGGNAGAMLSGGLDSSSVACLAARQVQSANTDGLPTFSLVFDETPELSERPFIEAVLAEGDFAPSFIPSNRLAHFAELDSILDEQQDLFLAPNLPCSRQIYRRAQAEGVRILLDGHGGDEVAPVGGARLYELAAQGSWLALWYALDGALVYDGQSKLLAYWRVLSHYRPLRRLVRFRRSIRRRLGLAPAQPDPFTVCINRKFAAQTGVVARSRKRNTRQAGQAVTEQSIHYAMVTGPLQSYAFEILDRTAAAAGVEARYPFWDKRLVEFCISLDPAEKLNNGWGRLIMRRAMEGILPPTVQWRRFKFDFTSHIATSIVRDHSDLVLRTLEDGRNGLGDYVDLPAVRLMMDRLKTSISRANGYEVQAIFRTMVLAFWLKNQIHLAPANALV
jgi:asparagine synthase (glutamine-hydrolysing)